MIDLPIDVIEVSIFLCLCSLFILYRIRTTYEDVSTLMSLSSVALIVLTLIYSNYLIIIMFKLIDTLFIYHLLSEITII